MSECLWYSQSMEIIVPWLYFFNFGYIIATVNIWLFLKCSVKICNEFDPCRTRVGYMGQVTKLRLFCYLFCNQLIAKPGNKTAIVPWPDPYVNYTCTDISWRPHTITIYQSQSCNVHTHQHINVSHAILDDVNILWTKIVAESMLVRGGISQPSIWEEI